MLILFCYLVAHVVVKAAEETWGYAKDHAKGGARKAVGDFVGRHKEDYKYGPGSWKFWAWLAGATAWITGKSVKHGVGGVRAAVRGARKGRAEAKEGIRLARDHKEARKINEQIDWEEMLAWLSEKLRDSTLLPQPEAQPEEETPGDRVRVIPQTERKDPPSPPRTPIFPPPPERTEMPPPEIVDAEIVEGQPKDSSKPEIWDIEEVVEDQPLEVEPPLEITAGGQPQGEIVTVPATESTPAIVEVSNIQNARDCMNEITGVLAGELAQIEHCVAWIDRTKGTLSAALVAVEGLINGFQVMDMDPTTVNQATNILEGLMAAIQAADDTREQAANMFVGVAESQVATTDTLQGMDDRHRLLEEAHAATAHAAKREAYAA